MIFKPTRQLSEVSSLRDNYNSLQQVKWCLCLRPFRCMFMWLARYACLSKYRFIQPAIEVSVVALKKCLIES